MKKIKILLLILVIVTAFITFFYTINSIIETRQYAVSIPEEDRQVGDMDDRDGIRWRIRG